ncbi:MAG: TolC family protein, partial [Gammaproteobacteria bacterium]
MKRGIRFLALACSLALSPLACAGQTPQTLTLQDAEKIALQNHPQIQVASYLANAAKAQVTQAKSAYYPRTYGSITGVESEHGSRIAAGGLN